ncbi:hypothetical protein [Clostridium saccharobutylicum]|uniref:hypothetical protein n=1 Tax=Clostridium saccharobutylicum TaxID=169679 RepID=UPI0003F93036|nr:hypothetical protein [Clostridium saccharobutylicum]AQR91711.1 hypothetical protein CLOSC_34370 [Clostridium saccharobutylicum]AQS01615.1 hypothetical protein CSACC_34440 [Clostridium saccharobutylicum]AQS11225.1 hypothetical protein CLOBY_33790 [Clostridium saccharobutylicum]AQS15598.1 hypothetical protein CLOSACC_34440 [Clostridium saccharobutylicum]MBA2907317.1 hypothetical protein [Clostridium saccharobutylicum]
MERDKVKKIIKEWILRINNEEVLPDNIEALNFGLFEPYGIELIGALIYDAEDDDWACEEDFIPKERECPKLNVDYECDWRNVLNEIHMILKELVDELKELPLFSVKHITTGFCDGDLVVVR